MQERYYNFLVYRLLCLIMALTVINLSIDVREMSPRTGRTAAYYEDISVNKIESIGELLLEECFGLRNAVPEHDDPDDESELTELEQDYDFTQLFKFTPLLASVQYLLTGNVPFLPASISVHVPEIIAPPPQVRI